MAHEGKRRQLKPAVERHDAVAVSLENDPIQILELSRDLLVVPDLSDGKEGVLEIRDKADATEGE